MGGPFILWIIITLIHNPFQLHCDVGCVRRNAGRTNDGLTLMACSKVSMILEDGLDQADADFQICVHIF